MIDLAVADLPPPLFALMALYLLLFIPGERPAHRIAPLSLP